MNRLVVRGGVWLALAMGVVISDSAWSQEPVAAADGGSLKVGVVNRKAVYERYAPREALLAELEAEVAEMQAKIDEQGEAVQAAKAAYDEAADSLSASERSERAATISRDFQRWKTDFARFEAEIENRSRRVQRRLRDEINEGVRAFGAAQKFDLIFEGELESGSGLVYFGEALDITDAVVAFLNEQAASAEDQDDRAEQ
jgi:outer membrane protein